MKLALGLILAMAANAYADEDHSKDEDQAFLTAIQKHDAKALAALVQVPFKLKGVPFKSADCTKKLGAVAKDAKQLVACLAQVKLGDGGFEKWGDDVDSTQCTSKAMIGGWDTVIVLETAAGHPFKVSSLEMQEMEGEVGGVRGGYRPMCVAHDVPPPPPPPPPPGAPSNVPPTLLENFRIAGNKAILPDDKTKTEIVRSGKDKVIGAFKLCVASSGEISSVSMLKTTGFSAYDATIQSTIRNEWKYKPYLANGKAIAVCTAVTFIYGT